MVGERKRNPGWDNLKPANQFNSETARENAIKANEAKRQKAELKKYGLNALAPLPPEEIDAALNTTITPYLKGVLFAKDADGITTVRLLTQRIVQLALNGDVKMIQLLFDRVDGLLSAVQDGTANAIQHITAIQVLPTGEAKFVTPASSLNDNAVPTAPTHNHLSDGERRAAGAE